MVPRYRSIVVATLLATLVPTSTWGQSGLKFRDRDRADINEPLIRQSDGPLALPNDDRLWHNSPPLSLESLSGKGVVFYFFEEEDPRIVANWPALLRLANEYDGKPILFVAVNSGSDPRTLKRYVSSQRISWPVIHDFDRSLENAMGVPKLTPQGEVFAVKYISASGELAEGQGSDFAATAQAALKGAEWRVDPSAIPSKLRPAWKAIELGDFSAASRAVTQAVKSNDGSIKSAGEKLLAAVEEEITAEATEAQAALSEGEDWRAYGLLKMIGDRYDGYDLPLIERAESKSKELSKSSAVKGELAAKRLLDKAIALGSKGTAGAVKRAKGQLQRLVTDHPSTEAAARAQDILASFQ